MPIKGKRPVFTPQEKRFAQTFANTGDPQYSAEKAGYASPAKRAYDALAKPLVQAEIQRNMLQRLNDEVLPLALDQHIALLQSSATPAGAKATLIKLAYDRTLGIQGGKEDKPLHELTGEELAERIERLRTERAQRALPVIDAAPAEAGLFE